jgi:hypothetical protein
MGRGIKRIKKCNGNEVFNLPTSNHGRGTRDPMDLNPRHQTLC